MLRGRGTPGRVAPARLGGGPLRRARGAGAGRRAAPASTGSRSRRTSSTCRAPPTPPRTWTGSSAALKGSRCFGDARSGGARRRGTDGKFEFSIDAALTCLEAGREPRRGEGLDVERLRRLRADVEAWLGKLSARERLMVTAAAARGRAVRRLARVAPDRRGHLRARGAHRAEDQGALADRQARRGLPAAPGRAAGARGAAQGPAGPAHEPHLADGRDARDRGERPAARRGAPTEARGAPRGVGRGEPRPHRPPAARAAPPVARARRRAS